MQKYTYDEVFSASKKYFGGNELSAKVFVDKYALQDNDGNYLELTPDDMHRRIARELARVERKKFNKPFTEDEIYERLQYFEELIPQGSPMYGIGNYYQTSSLSNCYVIDSPEDSYGGIMRADEEIAQISKRRGGIGLDISNLRPKDAPVKNAAKTTSGAITFMERFSNTLREVGQFGRRGAGMITISVHHPDILEFVNIKRDLKRVTGANISVRLSDEFLLAVDNDLEYELRFPVDSKTPKISKKVKARDIWDSIIDSAHAMAEPGLLFWDNIIRESPADCYPDYQTKCVNPCLTGDTLVLTADGRGHVPIKELAESGDDLDVFCFDKEGQIVVRRMRNPRISGYNQDIVKVTIENGHTIRVTKNHKFLLTDGSYKEAQFLKKGDSLEIAKLYDSTKYEKNIYRYRVLSNRGKSSLEHRIIAKHKFGNLRKKMHVHHIDENPNSKTGVTNDVLWQHALALTKLKGRRFSTKDWHFYAKEHNLPLSFTNFRRAAFGSINEMSKKAAIASGYVYVNESPQTLEVYRKAIASGYSAKIKEGKTFVEKTCEHCGSKFDVNYFSREVGCCSQNCASTIGHALHGKKIHNSLTNHWIERNKTQKTEQAQVFNNLKSELGRVPEKKEWQQACRNAKIPHRIGTKHGFRFYKDLKKFANDLNHRVLSVDPDGKEDVYNGTVDDYHNFFVGGWEEMTKSGRRYFVYLNNKNCGELVLSPGDSCRLLSINLFSCIDDPYTDKAKINKEKLWDSAYFAQRMMDNIVDLELECVDRIIAKIDQDPESEENKRCELNLWKKIRKACENGRRTGTGTTALGDTLAAINVKFGSDESIEVARDIYSTISLACYTCSVDMAEEIGPFPVWDHELEKDNPYLLRLKDKDPGLWERMKKVGRRNIALLTNAPTGSISIEACVKVNNKRYHNTTSGIEALFMESFTRRKKGNPGDKNFRSDFTDQNGDHWMEFKVYHEPILAWHSVNPDKDINDNPYNGCCAQQIDWVNRVKMQAAIQESIDHSVSTTINLPEDVSKEEVAKIYMQAWKSKCKGMTVYRDNCRTGVLVSESKKENGGIQKTEAPKRPQSLPCSVHHITVKGVPYFVLIGLMNNEPYEVFAGQNKKAVSSSIKSGVITKKKRGKYHAEFEDGSELSPITAFIEDEEETITRLVSTSLRHGTDIAFLVHQLEKSSGDMQSFSKCIARALKKQIKNGTKVHGEECPDCNGDLVREEGCISCKSCGYSKCK